MKRYFYTAIATIPLILIFGATSAFALVSPGGASNGADGGSGGGSGTSTNGGSTTNGSTSSGGANEACTCGEASYDSGSDSCIQPTPICQIINGFLGDQTCGCPTDYMYQNGKCVSPKPTCSSTSSACTCPGGLTVSGNQCVPPTPVCNGIQQLQNTAPAFTNLNSLFNLLKNFLFYISGIAVVIMFLYGGFLYMTSQGEPEKLKKAQSILLYTVIGIAIIALSAIIISLVAKLLGINVSNII